MANWCDILVAEVEKKKLNLSIKPKKRYLLPAVPVDTLTSEEFNKLIKLLTSR